MLTSRWDWSLFRVCDVCFCCSCQQFWRSSVLFWFWLPRLQWCRAFCLLSSSDEKKEQRIAVSETVREIQGSQLFELSCHSQRAFLCCYPSAGSREKIGSKYLKNAFRREARKFLGDFVNCVLSNVAARSAIGQMLSFFCPPILIDGDDHAPMQLFDMLLDGLLEKGWVRNYHSILQEQRQLERFSTKACSDVGNNLTFCSSQVGFRVWRKLHKV